MGILTVFILLFGILFTLISTRHTTVHEQPFPKPDVGPSSHYNLPNLLGPMGLFPSHQQQKKIFYIIPRAFLSYEKRIDINGQ